MPRIKQPPKAPGSSSLDGCSLAFGDIKKANIPFNHVNLADKTFTQLETEIEDAGGSVVTKVEVGKCTHFIATSEQYEKSGARIKSAIKYNIPILSYDWLAASLVSNDAVIERTYSLHQAPSASPPSASPNGSIKANGNSTKRARDADDDAERGAKKVKAEVDDNKANPSGPHIPEFEVSVPVDTVYFEHSGSGAQVHQDKDGTFLDATLNQTESGKNANKFYRLQLLKQVSGQYFTWTRWGRVGDKGQSKELGDGSLDSARIEFEKKFKDKTGLTWANRDQPPKTKKYTLIEINYEESDGDKDESFAHVNSRRGSKESIVSSTSSEKVESKLPQSVSNLMSLIFNNEFFSSTLADLDYDATKMPLGKLSKKTLLQGYEVLKELSILIGNGSRDAQAISDRSNSYYSLIPHAFGRNRPPTLASMDMIKKEVTLLESLTDMQLANDIMKIAKADKVKEEKKVAMVDRQYQGLGMQEMTPLDSESNEYRELSDYLIKSAGSTHSIRYKVEDIFRIERHQEKDRFHASRFAKLPAGKSDRRLLWHGSRTTNFGGILSQGLRIAPPEAPVSGYMFGKGIYLANISTKSANYCAAHSSGHTGLLLLCEAELGNPSLKLQDAAYDAGEQAAEKGCISTWGVGQTTPKRWKDAACVHPDLKGVIMPDVTEEPGQSDELAYLQYDEFICYAIEQVRLRYLLRVKMN